jgi:hypothetical protein
MKHHESDNTNDHYPTLTKGVLDHRCAICGNKPYEHAWHSGWDAIVEEPEDEDELEEALEVIDQREPIRKPAAKKKP